MNVAELQKKLIAAGRRQPADDRVPYAFEKRILAQLRAQAADQWVFWARGMWRAAASCVAVAGLLGVITLFQPQTPDNSRDLSQDFENALLASADLPDTSSVP